MKFRKILLFVSTVLLVAGVAGCQSIPPEQQKNYALVVSQIGETGTDMDTNKNQMVAYISYIDGKPQVAGPEVDMAPGRYRFQVGIGCGNTATCRPGRPYDIEVEAGKRYVLKPDGVYVSDRFGPRTGEVRYETYRQGH